MDQLEGDEHEQQVGKRDTDLIWIGRANQLRQIVVINCPADSVARKMADSVMSGEPIKGACARQCGDSVAKLKVSIKGPIGLAGPVENGLDF